MCAFLMPLLSSVLQNGVLLSHLCRWIGYFLSEHPVSFLSFFRNYVFLRMLTNFHSGCVCCHKYALRSCILLKARQAFAEQVDVFQLSFPTNFSMGFQYISLKVLTQDFGLWLCRWVLMVLWCKCCWGLPVHWELTFDIVSQPRRTSRVRGIAASNCCGWSSGHSGNRPVGFSHGVLWWKEEGMNQTHPFFFSVLAGSQLICHAIPGRWCGEHGQKCFSQGRIYPSLPIPCGAHHLLGFKKPGVCIFHAIH